MSSRVATRISKEGPKKILACDGGGILGLVSVEILLELEARLRHHTGDPQLVLADWFDFVCGTSTGAIIATCISAGMPVSRIREFYLSSGKQMFDKASLFKRLRYSYNDEPLALKLRQEINQALGYSPDDLPATLGDDGLRTLLMIVMRNHTTDSPWPLTNNPHAKYNSRHRHDCNLLLPLWQLVRASSAAPVYFPPEVITLAEDTEHPYQFVFVDGGVTTYNNPAFLAFQMATASPYRINWPTGPDKLLIVSVGTGSAARARPDLKAADLTVIDHAKNIPAALMNSASAGWDMACRLLGECRFGPRIDREYGDMIMPDPPVGNWTGGKHFAYVRYDPDVTQEGLKDLGLPNVHAPNIQMLDSIEHIGDIQEVGATYARQALDMKHFHGFV